MGLTYSELYRIEPTDIDWDGNQVWVAGTKTHYRKRAIPMTKAVRSILARRHTQRPMFPAWSNRNILRNTPGPASWRLSQPAMSANDLRRTFATWLARNGIPLSNVSKLMGALRNPHAGIRLRPGGAGQAHA